MSQRHEGGNVRVQALQELSRWDEATPCEIVSCLNALVLDANNTCKPCPSGTKEVAGEPTAVF